MFSPLHPSKNGAPLSQFIDNALSVRDMRTDNPEVEETADKGENAVSDHESYYEIVTDTQNS